MKIRLLVFNSGSGSGFENLVESIKNDVLRNTKIVGLITDNSSNLCVKRAERLTIPWHLMSRYDAEDYQAIVEKFDADYVALSGWLKLVKGLNPRTTFNIHPGPLPDFGGKGMYGHHVHDAVIKVFHEGKIKESEICMHFVIEEYDQGTVFYRCPVMIKPDDTSETLGFRTNEIEHLRQPRVTNLVVNGQIRWDGKNPQSLVVPSTKEFRSID